MCLDLSAWYLDLEAWFMNLSGWWPDLSVWCLEMSLGCWDLSVVCLDFSIGCLGWGKARGLFCKQWIGLKEWCMCCSNEVCYPISFYKVICIVLDTPIMFLIWTYWPCAKTRILWFLFSWISWQSAEISPEIVGDMGLGAVIKNGIMKWQNRIFTIGQ